VKVMRNWRCIVIPLVYLVTPGKGVVQATRLMTIAHYCTGINCFQKLRAEQNSSIF
jgi:hypothetical protein